MANHFEGEFHVGKTSDEVYDFLTDPNRFAPLLPDFESLSVQNDREFTVNVKVGISHIRGTASVRMRLLEADRPDRAVYQGQGSVAGGEVNFTASFDLKNHDNGTQVHWTADAQLFGRLIWMAGGLLEPLARKNVQKLIGGLQAALS